MYIPVIMKTTKTLMLFVSLAWAVSTVAVTDASGAPPSPDEDPIDREIERSLKMDGSKLGQAQAYNRGHDQWDAELNRVYQKAQALLSADAEGKKTLKDAQLAWIRFRDAEFKLIDRILDVNAGSVNVPASASARMKIVRERALTLRRRVEQLSP
ncbi:MAG: DUF1311 domain-containing protein [Candidatus Riflebacteria bacterium]|nr:DUF1311 domain-containing protein [Candidatus Riflebacteria bacterium]